MADKIIDYTKMDLGKVTRMWKGRRSAVIARCPKCGRKGERSVSIPNPTDAIARMKPYIHVTHLAEVHRLPENTFFGGWTHVKDSCTVPLVAGNVDDLLNVEERKRYDAMLAELRSYVEQF